MGKKAIKSAVRLLATALFLVASSTAWSATIIKENPLGSSYYNGNLIPRIEMTGISLQYKVGKHDDDDDDDHHRGREKAGEFTGKSKGSSTFTLYGPNSDSTRFKGSFFLEASITSTGELLGGDFTFRSKDPLFGFGHNKWGNVFSGELTDLGWSASGDLVEFATGNFSGWACDRGWCTEAERLWFNTDGFPNSAWTKNWQDKNASGTAVIPVPAAIWLLGSGLMGMIGFAKRKKSASFSCVDC